MSQLDELTAGLATLQQSVSDLGTRVSADLQKLEGELTAAQSAQGVDLSGPIQTVQAIQQQVSGIDPAQAAAAPPAA